MSETDNAKRIFGKKGNVIGELPKAVKVLEMLRKYLETLEKNTVRKLGQTDKIFRKSGISLSL